MQYAFAPNLKNPTAEVTLQTPGRERVVKPFKREDRIALEGIGEIPPGYVIRSQNRRFRQWLDSHHIDYQVVQQAETVQLEQQRVADLEYLGPYQAGNPRTGSMSRWMRRRSRPSSSLRYQNIHRAAAGPLDRHHADPRSSNSLYQAQLACSAAE